VVVAHDQQVSQVADYRSYEPWFDTCLNDGATIVTDLIKEKGRKAVMKMRKKYDLRFSHQRL
jgi:hypothetical protein